MKIVTIIGARPQFIKAAVVSRAIRGLPPELVSEKIVHTGQHYDANMSDVFFDEMDIPRPAWHLGVGSGNHGAQTGEMLRRIEEVLVAEKPDVMVVYGDTNSTIAGALAAAKLHIPVAHVEAGLRSFNRRMPEEINRILTDQISRVLFCPTVTAVENLRREGIPSPRIAADVVLSGDVMCDAARFYADRGGRRPWLATMGLEPKGFVLATIHRAESTDREDTLEPLLEALDQIGRAYLPVVWPVHPRTRNFLRGSTRLRAWIEETRPHFRMIEPLGYLDMVAAEAASRLIVTDSGGVQKEAFFHRVPCVTLRTETEWVELIDAGWNKVVGLAPQAILDGVRAMWALDPATMAWPALYGNGTAGEEIVRWLIDHATALS